MTEIPAVKVENLSLAFLCIRKCLPMGLTCEEVTILMDEHMTCWSALVNPTLDCLIPKTADRNCIVADCIDIKRLMQIFFDNYGVVEKVSISGHKQPDGDVSYKWQFLITPHVDILFSWDAVEEISESTPDQIHN